LLIGTLESISPDKDWDVLRAYQDFRTLLTGLAASREAEKE